MKNIINQYNIYYRMRQSQRAINRSMGFMMALSLLEGCSGSTGRYKPAIYKPGKQSVVPISIKPSEQIGSKLASNTVCTARSGATRGQKRPSTASSGVCVKRKYLNCPPTKPLTPPNTRSVFPSPSGQSGIPNATGRQCFMNSVLQVVTALYADQVPSGKLADFIKEMKKGLPIEREKVLEFNNQLPLDLNKMVHSGKDEDPQECLILLDHAWSFLPHYTSCNSGSLNPIDGTAIMVSPEETSGKVIMSNEVNKDGTYYNFNPNGSNDADFKSPICVSYNRNIKGSKSTVKFSDVDYLLPRKPPTPQGQEKYWDECTLCACIVHKGSSVDNGHYIAYYRKGNSWYCANDATVTNISETEALNIAGGPDTVLWWYKKAAT